MAYLKKDPLAQRSYQDSSSFSMGYFAAEYRHSMFYSLSEAELFSSIKYGQIRVDYDDGFSRFAASLRGEFEIPYTHFITVPEHFHEVTSLSSESESFDSLAPFFRDRNRLLKEMASEIAAATKEAAKKNDLLDTNGKGVKLTLRETKTELVHVVKKKIIKKEFFLERL